MTGPCGSRFQTFTSSLKNWCSRVWLLAGKSFFVCVCKGIRINTQIKNYAQHPLVWKESNLRLAPLPLDVPRAGQLLTPKVDVFWRHPGASALLPAQSTRLGPQCVLHDQGSWELSTWTAPSYNIISNHQLTFKYFLQLR